MYTYTVNVRKEYDMNFVLFGTNGNHHEHKIQVQLTLLIERRIKFKKYMRRNEAIYMENMLLQLIYFKVENTHILM